MILISPVDVDGSGLASPTATTISKITNKTYAFNYNYNRFLSRFFSRSRIEKIADSYLSRYARNNEIIIFRSVLPKCAEKANKTYVIDGVPEISEFIRLAIKEYEYYGMEINKYYFHRLRAQRETLSSSKKTVVMSSFAKKTFENAGYSNIINAGIGVDTEKYRPSNNIENFNALMVSSITPMKGIRYLVDAWKIDPFPLTIVGNMPYQIEKTIPKEIKLAGFCDPLEFYKKSNCFIFPSIAEGFGKTILEAMSCGLPVITTRNTGGPDVIDDSGIIIPEKNSEKLSKAIIQLKNNPKKRKIMGKRSRRYSMRYSWKKYEERVKEIFD